MRAKFIIFALVLVSSTLYSQQDAQYTNYMYNTNNINPAYAGSRGVTSVFGLYRTQWVGMDGAPVTSSFSVNAPFDYNLGGGLSFVNDRIGPTVSNTISADVSYTIHTSETYQLAFGIKASGNLFNLDATKLNPKNQDDPSLQNLDNQFTPNVGAGVYFYSDKLYIGLSAPSIFTTTRYSDDDIAIYEERVTAYFIGGYVFDLNRNLKFKPTFVSKLVKGAPAQLDVSANFLFNDKFTIGAAWRWDAAASIMAGFQISDGLMIGYSYDLETTELNNYNSGSHEIFLRFEFIKHLERVLSPRFF